MHQVAWQFFGVLNDFLPRERRWCTFFQPLKPGQSQVKDGVPQASIAELQFGQTVKDAFEAIGVPHPEVALVLVNGLPVDFSHQLCPDDGVQVYSHHGVPEALAGAAERRSLLPAGKPRFILDVHLGGLVRYLRLAGFDCLYSAQDWGDARLAELAQEQTRVVLTRDVGLLKRNLVDWGYRLRSNQPKVQFTEVVDHFRLRPWFDPFNRCSLCNSEELVQLNREEAVRHMPVGVPQAIEELWRCQTCGKIYWQGSHYDGIQRFMQSV